MSYPALEPWLTERIVADDAALLAVDKPHGVAVHGGDSVVRDDLVSRLKAWLQERGEADYLGVHQRLDKDASGVLVFARRADQNPLLAAAFAKHELERVYLAIVDGELGGGAGTLVHRLEPTKGGPTRVVLEGGQRAVVSYRVLRRVGRRALLELRPQTGRTHQLRVQLAASGAPIAGDRIYGGAPAPRLMLHAAELGVLGHRFCSRVPHVFEEWMDSQATLGPPDVLRSKLRDAAWLRQPLASDNDAYRIANDEPDLLPGVTIDRYGGFAVLNVASDEAWLRRGEVADHLIELGARGVYLKARVRADVRRLTLDELAPAEPIRGAPAPSSFVVHEGSLRFAVRLGMGLSTGLFVDQRESRRLVGELARGRRVLNLFAYTGSFSVAAALGGAHTTSVDSAAPALSRARENFVLNGLDPAQHRFVKADAIDWLKRARQHGPQFDLIVLDPPSFGTRGRGSPFSVEQSLLAVAHDALTLLAPGGVLLTITNHRKTSLPRLRKLLHQAAGLAGRQLAQLKDLRPPLDCPPAFHGPLPSKGVLLTLV